jgi:hypothetical protein
LEKITNKLEVARNKGGADQVTVQMALECSDILARRIGFHIPKKSTIALESGDGYTARRNNTVIAIEEISQIAKDIWEAIKRFFKDLWNKLKALWDKIFGTSNDLKQELKEATKEVKELQAEVKKNDIKLPEENLEAVCKLFSTSNANDLGGNITTILGNHIKLIDYQKEVVSDYHNVFKKIVEAETADDLNEVSSLQAAVMAKKLPDFSGVKANNGKEVHFIEGKAVVFDEGKITDFSIREVGTRDGRRRHLEVSGKGTDLGVVVGNRSGKGDAHVGTDAGQCELTHVGEAVSWVVDAGTQVTRGFRTKVVWTDVKPTCSNQRRKVGVASAVGGNEGPWRHETHVPNRLVAFLGKTQVEAVGVRHHVRPSSVDAICPRQRVRLDIVGEGALDAVDESIDTTDSGIGSNFRLVVRRNHHGTEQRHYRQGRGRLDHEGVATRHGDVCVLVRVFCETCESVFRKRHICKRR